MPYDYGKKKEKDTDKDGLFVGEVHATDVDAGKDLKDVEEYVSEYDR